MNQIHTKMNGFRISNLPALFPYLTLFKTAASRGRSLKLSPSNFWSVSRSIHVDCVGNEKSCASDSRLNRTTMLSLPTLR